MGIQYHHQPVIPSLSHVSSLAAGTNRISQAVQGAHEGSIFALCILRNGTLVSGGKDRRLVSWNSSYQQIQNVEVNASEADLCVVAHLWSGALPADGSVELTAEVYDVIGS